MPGFNDTLQRLSVGARRSRPRSTTRLTPTTFLEATYGFANRRLGQIVNSPPTNRFNAGLGGLPHIYPDANILPAGSYNRQVMEDVAPPFYVNGRAELPPTFLWGNRIARQHAAEPGVSGLPQHQPRARRLAERHADRWPAHAEGRLLQQPEPEGAEPEPAERAAVPGRRSTSATTRTTRSTAGSASRTRRSASSRPTRSRGTSSRATSSTGTSKATFRTTGRSTNRLTLDYGAAVHAPAAAVRLERPGVELLHRQVHAARRARARTPPGAWVAPIPARAPTAGRSTRSPGSCSAPAPRRSSARSCPTAAT